MWPSRTCLDFHKNSLAPPLLEQLSPPSPSPLPSLSSRSMRCCYPWEWIWERDEGTRVRVLGISLWAIDWKYSNQDDFFLFDRANRFQLKFVFPSRSYVATFYTGIVCSSPVMKPSKQKHYCLLVRPFLGVGILLSNRLPNQSTISAIQFGLVICYVAISYLFDI